MSLNNLQSESSGGKPKIEEILPAGADAVAVAAVHRHRDPGKWDKVLVHQPEAGQNPGSGGNPDEGGGGGGQNEFGVC